MSQPMPGAASAPQDLPAKMKWTLKVESCVDELTKLNLLEFVETPNLVQAFVADQIASGLRDKHDLHDVNFNPVGQEINFTVVLDPQRSYKFSGHVNPESDTMNGRIDGPPCDPHYPEDVGTWTATAQPGQDVPVE